ncbi:MAG: LysR substrate-binding domain-containing protein [Bacillota bacterium]
MDLYHLQTFQRVAQLMSFTRAAEDLSLSQSAVSRHIEALEREFGLELFARHGRGATLTEAGNRLLEYAERILRMAQDASRALGELRDLESGQLRIGASTTAGHYLLGRPVAAYQDRYPGIALQLEVRDSRSVLRLVDEGAVDLAVLPAFEPVPGVITEPLLVDQLSLVAAPSHPLAACPAIRLEDLTGVKLFVREEGSHTRKVVEQLLAARSVPVILRELGSTEAIKQAVAAGIGVAFCSGYAAALELQQGALVSLSGPELPIARHFVLAFPKGARRAPAAMAFAALLRKMLPALEDNLPVTPRRAKEVTVQ